MPHDGTNWDAQLQASDNASQLVSVWKSWQHADAGRPVEAYLKLAGLLHDLNRWETAVEVLQAAHERWPQNADVAHKLGWRLRQLGHLDEAASVLEKAIEINPMHLDALGILGGIHKRRGQVDPDGRRSHFEKARDMYARAHAVAVEDRYPLAGLGAMDAVLERADSDNGKQWYRKIIDLVPSGSSDTVEDWDQIVLAEAHLVVGEPSARDLYARAVRGGASREALRSAADQLAFLSQNDVQSEDCEAILADVLLPALGEESSHEPGPLVVHLSDIHFGKKGDTVMHRFGSKASPKLLADRLSKTWEQLPDFADRPVVVVVSGDLAYEAGEEFEEVAEFLSTIMKKFELPAKQVVVVPGNHDVNWKDSAASFVRRLDRYISFLGELYGDDKSTLYPDVDWQETLFAKERKTTADSLLSVHDLSHIGLVILGLNSCVEESHESHYGFVSKHQLDRMAEVFAQFDEKRPRPLRVVVLHHHVLPLDDSIRFHKPSGDPKAREQALFDVSLVRNSTVLERYLHRAGVDVVLHGHKHQPSLRQSLLFDREIESPKPILICSAGSTGVVEEEVPHNYGNHFGLLRFRRRFRLANQPFVDVEWWQMPFDDVNDWKAIAKWEVPGS